MKARILRSRKVIISDTNNSSISISSQEESSIMKIEEIIEEAKSPIEENNIIVQQMATKKNVNRKRLFDETTNTLYKSVNSIKTKLAEELIYERIYEYAIQSLQEYSAPKDFPCREEEMKHMENFILDGIKMNGSSYTLYISGVPGIGKTLSFKRVCTKIAEDPVLKKSVCFINLNGMNLQYPETAYMELLKQLFEMNSTKKKYSKAQAKMILGTYFREGKIPQEEAKYLTDIHQNKTKIILLDELDYFVTKDQEIIYNFFDWPSSPYAKMIIIGIANTMNLLEKLNSKILSRCGTNRLVFKAYTSEQIKKIITSRIEGQNIFDPEAVDFLCKKISISSSDIRKTLHVCRKSVEMAEQDFLLQEDSSRELIKVNTDHVRKSYSLLYCSPCHESVSKFSKFQKLILISIAMAMKCSGDNQTFLNDIVDRFRNMCIAHEIKMTLGINEIMRMLRQMEVANILEITEKLWVKNKNFEYLHHNGHRFFNTCEKFISLVINLDDLTNALKEDELFIKIFHNLK